MRGGFLAQLIEIREGYLARREKLVHLREQVDGNPELVARGDALIAKAERELQQIQKLIEHRMRVLSPEYAREISRIDRDIDTCLLQFAVRRSPRLGRCERRRQRRVVRRARARSPGRPDPEPSPHNVVPRTAVAA